MSSKPFRTSKLALKKKNNIIIIIKERYIKSIQNTVYKTNRKLPLSQIQSIKSNNIELT